MKAIILYHPKSEHAGLVEDYAHEYKKFKNRQLDLTSLETVKGAKIAELYDITSYPALLIARADGQLIKVWQGEELPQQSLVEGYLQA